MTISGQKYALITGAASGIGREYARQLAAKGYSPVLADRAEAVEAAAQEVAAEYGVEALPLRVDLAEPDAAGRIFAWTEERGIHIDVLVCNAGVLLFGELASASLQAVGRIISLHCTVTSQLCCLYAGQMQRRGCGGHILLMSSATAWTPYPTIAAYSATKAYLKTFGRALHDELADRDIRVTTVFPGAVDTPFYKLGDAWRRRFIRWGVMSTPQEVARRGLNALFRGRKRCIPGVFTKLCVWSSRLIPGWTVRAAFRSPFVQRRL